METLFVFLNVQLYISLRIGNLQMLLEIIMIIIIIIIIISVRFSEGNFESYFWGSVASAPWSLEYFWGIWKKNHFSLGRERTKWVISEGWTVSLHLMFFSQGVKLYFTQLRLFNGMALTCSSPSTLIDLTLRTLVMGKPHRQGN